MSRTKTRCLEIVENCQEREFEEFDFVECNADQFWKSPERLLDEDDFDTAYHQLVREISLKHFDKVLAVLRSWTNSSSHPDLKVRTIELFQSILLVILIQKVDMHTLLYFLDIGDRQFSAEGHRIQKKDYAFLKLLCLYKIRKTQHEVFPCGCAQKVLVELYREHTRLNEAFHAVLDPNPMFRRLTKTVPDRDPIQMLSFYTEVLSELGQCSAIEDSEQKVPSRFLQLFGFLTKVKSEDIPEACSHLLNIAKETNMTNERKHAGAIGKFLKTVLVPKVLDLLSSTTQGNFSRVSKQKIVQAIETDHFSVWAPKSEVLFAPIKLIVFLVNELDIWKIVQPAVESRIGLIHQSAVLTVSFISIAYRIDATLLETSFTFLSKQFAQSDEKSKTMLIFDIIEALAASNDRIDAVFTQKSKIRLLLNTEITSVETAELVFPFVSQMSVFEVNELKLTSMPEKCWGILFREFKDVHVVVESDEVWTNAVEKNSSDVEAISFISNQLRMMAERKERRALVERIQLIWKVLNLKGEKVPVKLPPHRLLLSIPDVILSFPGPQLQLLPSNTLHQILTILILSYCLYFDGNELQIQKQFQNLRSKLEQSEVCKDGPMECLEQICDGQSILKDASFLNKMEHQIIFKETQMDKAVADQNKLPRIKERISDVFSILFSKLAAQLQKLGDKGTGPYCPLLSTLCKNLEVSADCSKLSERIIRGACRFEEHWNSLFLLPKVVLVLRTAKQKDEGLMGKLLEMLKENQILWQKLNSRKDFDQFITL